VTSVPGDIATGPLQRATAPPAAATAPSISVVVLTYNEEGNIAECLRSCAWCDDVHVLDSGSTDRTRETAASMGATVHVNPFTSFGQQRNWAIDRVPCRHEWHFHLDADERFTPELVEEIRAVVASAPRRIGAYLVPSKMIFMGRWLKHAGGYPAYQVRLFHRDRCRFMDFGHGQREVCPGHDVHTLRRPYLHYNFSKGLNDWLHKHNAYSTRESAEAVAARRQQRPRMRDVLVGEPTHKRRAMKNLSYFIRCRAALRFLYLYVLRLGVLDGRAGFHYCAMMSMYEYWIELKIREQESPWAEQTRELASRLLHEAPTPTPLGSRS
jgi:glycosyltransferase involved in cell wall biosynthesis